VYDAIVVGARVAGSATALGMARKGLRVLVVDRAEFPSDTLSTHTVQVPGVGVLARLGVLDRLVASGAPFVRDVTFASGPVRFSGRYPAFDGADAVIAPRRTVLDAMLVDAARDAGAEVREHVTVEALEVEAGRVVGIRGRTHDGTPVSERARIVIGADGKHSVVARLVDAAATREDGPRSIAYYSYWSDVPIQGGAMHTDGERTLGVWPTNDGLVVTYLGLPAAAFESVRHDPEAAFLRHLDAAGALGEAVRAGRRVDRFYGTADLPNRYRRSTGPGWALVGDAGLVMDPITGQGIGHALRDAERLADAVAAGIGGAATLEPALAEAERRRNDATRPMYDMTIDLAAIRPQRPAERRLFEAISASQADIDRFLGVITGSVAPGEVFGPGNLRRLVGIGGLVRLMAARRASAQPAASPA
jgi:2-polyprenyl-6-methoxyphenol hydroxylase-like FAD-dependent oxidoreductase